MAIHQELIPDPRSVATRLARAALAAAQGIKTATNGTVSVANEDGTRTIIGAGAGLDDTGSKNGIAAFVGDTTPPSRPTGISAVSISGVSIVRWDGTLEDGIPADFGHVNVYVGGNKIGQMVKAGSLSVSLEAGQVYDVYATAEDVARDEEGRLAPNVSPDSDHVSVTGSTPAEEVTQYVWADEAGLHVSNTGDHDTSGMNILLTSTGLEIRDGNTVLSSFEDDEIKLGSNSPLAEIDLCDGMGTIGTIGSMLALFGVDVALKGNSSAFLLSNGSSIISASTGTAAQGALISLTAGTNRIDLSVPNGGGVGISGTNHARILMGTDGSIIILPAAGKSANIGTQDASGIINDSGIGMSGNNAVVSAVNVTFNVAGKSGMMKDWVSYLSSTGEEERMVSGRVSRYTGWRTLVAGGAWYMRQGGLVVVQMLNITLSAGLTRVLGSLPQGFRPPQQIRTGGDAAISFVSRGSAMGYAYVKTNGEVSVWAETAGDYSGQIVLMSVE